MQGYVDVWTGSEGLWKVMILRKGIVYEENNFCINVNCILIITSVVKLLQIQIKSSTIEL